MKTPNGEVRPTSQPDPRVMDWFLTLQSICFVIGGLIATVVLCGWLVPAVGSSLPEGWKLMKANTALGMLLCITNLILTQPKRGENSLLAGRICGVILVFVAGSALLGHLTGRAFWVDTLLAADRGAEMPGRMSVQTATFLILAAPTLIFEKTQWKWQSHLLDILIIAVIVLVLVIASGYLFRAVNLFGQSMETRTSPHTLICMIMVTTAAVVQRMPSGFFSLLAGIGIGSHIARITLPWALLLPFIIIGISVYALETGWISLSYNAALTTTAISVLLFIIVLRMARRVNWLELDLRDMSLTDELTKVNNRRSFYLLGEQMFREGRRNETSLTVLYFDLDGLKEVNDTLGHDAGSELLFDFANLLSNNFRRSDVVARLGGDEFAVLSRQNALQPALQRLDDAIAVANTTGNKPYRISYSAGQVTSDPAGSESFADLVARADAVMYENKQQKKALRKESYVVQNYVADDPFSASSEKDSAR